MKQLQICLLIVLFSGVVSAQIRLNVQGDARIDRRLEFSDNSIILGGASGLAGINDDGNNQNVIIGSETGVENISGNLNVYIGYKAGNKAVTNNSNTILGAFAGFNNVANLNTFVGSSAGTANTSGFSNTFVGYQSGDANTTGTRNTMMGRSSGTNNEDGSDNTFIGQQAGQFNTSGSQNTYLGRLAGDNNITGSRQTMLGYQAEPMDGLDNLDAAIAIGFGAKVGCSNCAVIGGTGGNAVNVGMGIAENLTARLSLLNDSNGAGPQLTLMEDSDSDFSRLKFENVGQLGHWILAARGNATATPRFNFFYNNEGGNGTNVMTLDGTNSNVGMGTVTPDPAAKLDVFGDIYLNGVFHASDRRFKEDIRPVRDPMALLSKISGVTYQFRKSEFGARSFARERQYGLIAQELEQVLPELVRDREDGFKAVNYEGLIPVLVEGVKEQQTKITSLEKTVAQQQTQLEALTKLVDRLLEERTGEDPSDVRDLLLQDTGGLGQNHPNPFHENTVVNYRIPDGAQGAYLQVSGTDGKIIDRIAIEHTGSGQVKILAGSYPAGTYFYSLVVDSQIVDTKKMVLTR